MVSRREGVLSEEPEEITGAQQQEKGIQVVRGEEVSEVTKLMAEEEGKGNPSKR